MIVSAYDWLGPEGPWPNGQNLDFYIDSAAYERSNYSKIDSSPYGIEKFRHPYTQSKLTALVKSDLEYRHITDCHSKFIYELTPLLKPYQWVDNAFDSVSTLAIQKQKEGVCLFVINDMNEGYTNAEYNFFENLHKQIDKHQLLSKNIVYITMNAILPLEYDKWSQDKNIEQIRIIPVFLFENNYNREEVKIPSKHFICLNRQPNPHRQCLVYELWKRDLLKYGYVSMPHPDTVFDFEFDKNNLKLFNLDDSRWDEFIASLPYIVDGRDFQEQHCGFNTIEEFYKDSLYSIVTEQTIGNSDCIKFSEKTFKAFDNYCLPLYMYSPGMCIELIKIGYTTDNTGIDRIQDDAKRFKFLIDTVEGICKKPIEELHEQTLMVRNRNYQNLKRRSKAARKKQLEFLNEWHES